MKIGALAKQTGVSRDTIRLYEQMGIVTGVTRPNPYNNYKDYAEKNVERIRFIKMMKELGLTLKECKSIIDLIETDQLDSDYQTKFIQEKISVIDDKLKELQKLKALFEQFLHQGCNNTAILDKINE